ncbi:MAG: hypothetical protein ACE364_00480 [Chlorobiota bacterium]
MTKNEINNKLPMSVGTIYKRIFISFLSFILLLISFCTFSKYKICRFPFDVLYGPSISIDESKEKGVFLAEYRARDNYIMFDTIKIEFKDIWLEKDWYTESYTNEVDPKSLKRNLMDLIIKLKEINGYYGERLLYTKFKINNQHLTPKYTLRNDSYKVSIKGISPPDTIRLEVYNIRKSDDSLNLFETFLIKK